MPTFILTTPVTSGSPGQAQWTDAAILIGGTAWLLDGNTSVNSATQFLGTLDANDLAFRTNNIERMRFADTGELGIGTTPGVGYGVSVLLSAFAGSAILLDSDVAGQTGLAFREPLAGPGVSSFVAANQAGNSYAYTLPPSVPDPGPADPGDMGLGFMQVDGAVAGTPTMSWVQTRQYTINSATTGLVNWNAGFASIPPGGTAAYIFDAPGTLQFDTVELALQEKYIIGAGGSLVWQASVRPGGGAISINIYNYGAAPSTADVLPEIRVRVTRS